MSKNAKIVLYVLLAAILIVVAVIVYNYSTGGTMFQGYLKPVTTIESPYSSADEIRKAPETDVRIAPETDVRIAPETDVRIAPEADELIINEVRI